MEPQKLETFQVLNQRSYVERELAKSEWREKCVAGHYGMR